MDWGFLINLFQNCLTFLCSWRSRSEQSTPWKRSGCRPRTYTGRARSAMCRRKTPLTETKKLAYNCIKLCELCLKWFLTRYRNETRASWRKQSYRKDSFFFWVHATVKALFHSYGQSFRTILALYTPSLLLWPFNERSICHKFRIYRVAVNKTYNMTIILAN